MKTLDVPVADHGLIRIDVDGEVEVVGNEFIRVDTDLQNVQPFENENVGLTYCNLLTLDDVVDNVAIDRCENFGPT